MDDIIKALYLKHIKKSNVSYMFHLQKMGLTDNECANIYRNVIQFRVKYMVNKKQAKQNFRDVMKALRKGVDEDTLNIYSVEICKQVAYNLQVLGSKKVALYAPIKNRGEINTEYLFNTIKNNGIEVYYPIVSGDHLIFAMVNNLNDLKLDDLGIPSPENDNIISAEQLDAIILPGLSFNPMTGARLGYGLGHYDKTLAGNKSIKIGLTLTKYLNRSLPSEDFDVNVNCIVTENDTIWISKPV